MSAHQNKGDPTFTLTLQADAINTKAKNSVFNAPLVSQVATLQTGDSIIDSGTGGTLNATFNPVATNIVGAAIQGVSTWNLTNEGTFNFGDGNTQLIAGGSLISGLSTLNDVNSNAPIVVGVTGASLESALTTIGMTSTDSQLNALIAPAALSGTNDSLTVNLNNAGVAGSFAQLTIGPDNGATNGYENWNISITGNNSVALSDGSATSATTMTISGSGNITLNLDASFANLATINVLATGTVTISVDPPEGQAGHHPDTFGFALGTGATALSQTTVIGAQAGDQIAVGNSSGPVLTSSGLGNTLLVQDGKITGVTTVNGFITYLTSHGGLTTGVTYTADSGGDTFIVTDTLSGKIGGVEIVGVFEHNSVSGHILTLGT